MKKQATEHSFRFHGATKEKLVRRYNYDLVEMLDRRFVAKITDCLKLRKECLQLEWADGNLDDYTTQIRHYCESNYDKNKFDLDSQKNEAFLAIALGKQAETEDRADAPRQTIQYEAKKWFQVAENTYDFTKVPLACMHYDEDIVRYNINRVPRKDIVVVAP
jgi:hypothetical protein